MFAWHLKFERGQTVFSELIQEIGRVYEESSLNRWVW